MLKFTKVPDEDRMDTGPRTFKNANHWIRFEGFVYDLLDKLSEDYNGGFWEFFILDNGGFFMSPDQEGLLHIIQPDNYFEGDMSAEAAGITACLYAYSHLSFRYPNGEFGELYHKLLELVYDHPECPLIMGAID